jgi:tetratricopeptide (TPR) repeat protein
VQEGLRISRSIDSLWGQAYTLMTLAPMQLAGGRFAEAIRALQEAIPLARQAHFGIDQELTVAQGGIYGFVGDLPRSIELLEGVRDRAHKPEDRLIAATMLAYVYVHHDKPAAAKAAFQTAQEVYVAGVTNPTLAIYRMVAPVIEAELVCVDGNYEQALDLASRALQKTGRCTIAADLRRIQGHALQALGRPEEARDALERALDEADEPDSDRMTWPILYILWSRRTVWKSLLTLSRLEAEAGDTTKAVNLAQEAREFITDIAHSLGDTNLRHRFFELPDLRHLMELQTT